MREIVNNIVTKNREKVALKVDQIRGSQTSGSCGKEKPSRSVKESWYKMAMLDAQEHETSRSMFRGSESLETSQTIMVGIAYV
jgi:hypothetical protein